MSLSSIRSIKTKAAFVDRLNTLEAIDDIRDYLQGCYEAPLPLLTEEQKRRRAFNRWMWNRVDMMRKIGVAEVVGSGGYEQEIYYPKSLESIGVDTPAKGNRFLDFYLQVYNPDRSWVSGCQVDQRRVAAIALTPNYNRLPSWVREGLMTAPESAKIGGDRIGNIWRLIPCIKAWKWCNQLPKRVAEKVGKASPRLRMLSAWAWQYAGYDGFWQVLSDLDRLPLGDQIEWMTQESRSYYVGWGRYRWAAFLEQSLNLPYGTIELPYGVSRMEGEGLRPVLEDAIAQFASPEIACRTLFGVAGKATVKAFKASDKKRWQWAKAIGEQNPDAVQKILTLSGCIEFQPEAVEFLQSLPMSRRIHLLGATTFRYRGDTCPISGDHIRDTGYLWSNIQNRPELGRVRCWFSVHETLAAAFVAELPDEELPIPQGWGPVDGLCAVDGTWSIELPKRVATLKYYGEALRNCVGGYGPAIKSGRSVVFAVRENGLLTHCVEVSSGYVRQFYRTGNSYADDRIQSSVCAALREAGLID